MFICKISLEDCGDWLEIDLKWKKNIMENLVNFNKGVKQKNREVWQLFWHGTVWIIWKARNELFFKEKCNSPADVAEMVKYNVWGWMKSWDVISRGYNYVDWEVCLNGVLNLKFSG